MCNQSCACFYCVPVHSAPIVRTASATRRKPASFRFRVIDIDGRPLSGAVYQISYGCKYRNLISDSNGCVQCQGILPGTYSLQEISAPSGYFADPDTHKVTVARNGCVKVDDLPLCCFHPVNPTDDTPPPQSASPSVAAVAVGDTSVHGAGGAGCCVRVTFPDGTIGCTQVASDGTWSIPIPADIILEVGDVVSVVQVCSCQSDSDPATIVTT
ncbi:MAG: Ig-like domain-containing protein [Oscillospiraceae bacterium]|nr:Ig-like domain-containing protein [Oscillospiraceae bacterium]